MKFQIPIVASLLFLLLVVTLLFFLFKYLRIAFSKQAYSSKKSQSRFFASAFFIVIWLLFLAVLSQTAFLQDFNAIPPHFAIVVLPAFIAVVSLSLSHKAILLLNSVSLKELIYVQTFRVFMEFILWLLYLDDIIPVQMTFEGYNYDILIGISALIVAYYYDSGIEFFNRKWFLIGWNIAGIVLLINIVVIAIISTPTPFRYFMNEPANTVIAYFPFVWLPGFVVPFALAMHLFSLRKLIANDFKINTAEHEH